MVPAKSRWCSEFPSHIMGVNSTRSPSFSDTRRMTSPHSMLSVNSGMCRPCCSRAAIGITIGVVLGRAATSVHLRSVRFIRRSQGDRSQELNSVPPAYAMTVDEKTDRMNLCGRKHQFLGSKVYAEEGSVLLIKEA